MMPYALGDKGAQVSRPYVRMLCDVASPKALTVRMSAVAAQSPEWSSKIVIANCYASRLLERYAVESNQAWHALVDNNVDDTRMLHDQRPWMHTRYQKGAASH